MGVAVTEDLDQAVVMATPVLREMRQTIDEMGNHIEVYLRAT